MADKTSTQAKVDAFRVEVSGIGVVTPPPPPPPPVSENVVLLGSVWIDQQRNFGPADRAKRSDIDAAIAATPKWTWFANAQEEYSPSVNGRAVNPGEWTRLPVWGNFVGVYKTVQRLMADGTARNINSKAGGDDIALNIVPWLNTYGLRSGERGVAITTPYTAWRGHSRRLPDGSLSMNPNVPYAFGGDVVGNLWYRMRDGSAKIVWTLPGAKEVHDVCARPASRKTLYWANTGANEVVEVLRGTTDFTVVSRTTVTRPTSVISTPDDKLYYANTSGVFGIGNALSVPIPNAFYLDYDRRGHLIVGTLSLQVWDVDPATGAATIEHPGGAAQTWVTVSVDRNGTCGEVDNIMLCHMHSAHNNTVTVRKGGVWKDGTGGLVAIGNGQTVIGSATWLVDVFGHYPWTAIYSPDSAEMYVEGVADGQGSVLAVRTPNMATEDAYDHVSFTKGREIIQNGCGLGTLVGSVPSFVCQMADQGWSGIGVTADFVALKTFAEQAAFIAQGMLGSFPRPFIKGRDMYYVLYFIGRSSMRGFLEGKPYFDALKTWAQAAYPWGTELPAIAQPNMPDTFNDTFIQPSGNASTVTLAFMDRFASPKTPGVGTSIKLVIDDGLPGSIEIAAQTAPFTYTLPVLSAGQHSVRPIVVAGAPVSAGKYSPRSIAVVA